MTVLEQINNQEIDNQISIAELRKAIEPGGFLDNNDNIQAVGQLLNNTETLDETDKELVNSLKTTIDSEINTILERGTVTEEDIKLINVRKELLGENDSRVQRLEELITAENSESNQDITEETPQIAEGPTKEEIIMQKFNELSEQNRNDIKNNLNFSGDIINDIDGLLETGDIDFTKIENIKAINLLNNIIRNDIERHNKLKNIVNEKTIAMSRIVNTRIGGNTKGNVDYYHQDERMLVQLRANICYGEELELNGIRGDNIWNVGETNEGKTNIYIYQLELKTRKDVTDIRRQFNQLLNIPNIDAKFIGISQESRDSIMREFLQFFLKIRVHGMFFENKIGTSNLESVLTNLINAEKYKGMSVDRYLEMGESEELTEEEQERRAKIRESLSGFVTMGQYFRNNAEESMNNLLAQDAANVEYNRQLYEVNEIRALQLKIQELYTLNSDTELSEGERREKIRKLGEEILNNPRLEKNQRNDVLMVLGINFSDILDESSFHEITFDEIMNQWKNIKRNRIVNGEVIEIAEGGLFRGKAYGEGGQRRPDKILYADGCNVTFNYHVETEYNMGVPERVNRMDILVDGNAIEIDRNGDPYLEGYEINININNELIIKKGGNGSDLQRTFGTEIYNEYQTARNEYNERNRENEEINDIMTQINSENILGLSQISDESKKIINDETGYTEAYSNYKATCEGLRYAQTQYAQYPDPPKQPNYSEYQELNIPGSEKLIVHIEPTQLNMINEAIQTYGERICFIPTKKTEKKIYELTISDLKITEEDEQGNINVYEINNEMCQGNKIREISGEEINEANHISNIIMATISHAPGLEDALNKAKNIDEDMKWMQNIYKKYDRGEGSENADGTRGLTDTDVNNLRIKATETAEYLNDICKFHNNFIQMKAGLERRYHGESNISTENEEKIKNLISCLDYLIVATTQGGELYEYCQSMLNAKDVHSNDTWLKRVGRRFKNNGLKIIGAIAGGVLAVILVPVTGGSSLAILAKMAMVMTVGGMIGGGAGQFVNEKLRSRYYAGGIEIDGRQIEVRYDDPTSLELAIEGKISRGDYLTQLAMNFIVGSATTFGCMAAGQLIGGWITKACESGRMSSGLKSFLNRFNKNFKVENNGDPMTDGIFKQMATKIGQNPKSILNNFNERFFKEFKEEILEEIGETGFDEAANAARRANGKNTGLSMILSGFGLLATAWHCITPGGNMTQIYKENGISLGNVNFGEPNTLEITLDYSGDYQTIINYYHENGFNIVNGHLEMPNPENPEITNVIYLQRSVAPLESRVLAGQFSGYGIRIDRETGKGYYQNLAKIQELELTGQANVTIDPTTKKVTIISGELTLELEQEYFGGKSHRFQVSEIQARTNSAKMDNILEEINNGNLQEKLQELRDSIQEQYKAATGEDIELTDEQLISVLDAHEQDGILGMVGKSQLKIKAEILYETITDKNVIRFLFEAGFCGKTKKSPNFECITQLQVIKNIQNMNKLLEKIDTGNKSEKLNEIRDEIARLYKEATNEVIEITDEQLISIIESYKPGKIIDKLNLSEKPEPRQKTIGDKKFREFLIESGFCHNEVSYLLNENGSRNSKEDLVDAISKGLSEGYSVYELTTPFIDKLALLTTNAKNDIHINELLEEGLKGQSGKEKVIRIYNGIVNKINNDQTGTIEKNRIETRLKEFIQTRVPTALNQLGNNFETETVLYNRGSVRNIAVTEESYTYAKQVLLNEIKDIPHIGPDTNYNEIMSQLNAKIDERINKTFGTNNLQDLTSPEHRAFYDHNGKILDENGIYELSQLIQIKGLQDCRLHAFTKELFFESRKQMQISQLENSKTGKSIEEQNMIDNQITILRNTNMIFMDASFSGNVDMVGMYQPRLETRTPDGKKGLVEGDETMIIEEHTFNLIEIPQLNPDGTIKTNPDGTAIKEVFFADSFYQGNGGVIYDLSYNTNRNNNLEIIGQKEGRGIELKIQIDGKDFTIKPLDRSMIPRGYDPEGITITNIEESQIRAIEKSYEEGAETVNILNNARLLLRSNLQVLAERLFAGDINELTTGTEVEIDGKKYNLLPRQQTLIEAAFKTYSKIDTTNTTRINEAKQSIINMINNVTTQQADIYTNDNYNAESRSSEHIFLENMQIFNTIYKENIENALTEFKAEPENDAKKEKFMQTINEYKTLCENEWKEYFERNRVIMNDENKRNEGYHRNSFEKIAQQFQTDMDFYYEIYGGLKEKGLYDEAYEIREFMVQQEQSLLQHTNDMLGHMIDFKKVKEELKGINGRELYNQLINIRGIAEAEGIDVKTLIEQKGINRGDVKEKTGITDTEIDLQALNNAIENIETSGLKTYYEIIDLVYSPEILKINMENAVYTDNPTYTSENRIRREYAHESKEHYIERMRNEAVILQNIEASDIGDIEGHIMGIIEGVNPEILNRPMKINIQNEISDLMTLCKNNELSDTKTYEICKLATEALIFQTMESQTRNMGDHGINHISGNIAKLNTYIEAGIKANLIPEGEVQTYKLMGALTHIFHDIGYAAMISKGSGIYDGSAIHPFTSKEFFDATLKGIFKNTGVNGALISQAIESHDGIRLNFGTPQSTFLSFVNLSDNMALGVDKVAEIRSNPHLLGHLATLYALDAAGIDITRAQEIIVKEIKKDRSINRNERENLISAIREISSFSMGQVDFWSISPITAMEIDAGIPTLSMFQGANIMLVAEICGIDTEVLNNAIEKYQNATNNGNNTEANEARNEILSLIKGKKFCGQIIKPLQDYADIYTLVDENGNVYPKTEKVKNGKIKKEYNRDEIKVDLLLGRTITFKDGNETVLHYKYETSTELSRYAELNSAYGNINMAETLGEGIDARNRLDADFAIETLGNIKQMSKTIIEKIGNKEDISIEIDELKEMLANAKYLTATNDAFTDKIDDYIEKYTKSDAVIRLYLEYKQDGNYKKLTDILKELGNDTDRVACLLVTQ